MHLSKSFMHESLTEITDQESSRRTRCPFAIENTTMFGGIIETKRFISRAEVVQSTMIALNGFDEVFEVMVADSISIIIHNPRTDD